MHKKKATRKTGTVLILSGMSDHPTHAHEKSLSHTLFHTLPLLYKTHYVLRGPLSASLQLLFPHGPAVSS